MKRKMKTLKFSNAAAALYLEASMGKIGIDKVKMDLGFENIDDFKELVAVRVDKQRKVCAEKSKCCESGKSSVICKLCEIQWSTSVAINCLNYGIATQNLVPEAIEKRELPEKVGKGFKVNEVRLCQIDNATPKKRSRETNSGENLAIRRRLSVTDDEEFYSCDENLTPVEIRSNGKPRSGKIRNRHASMSRGESLLNTPTTTDSEVEAESDILLAQCEKDFKKREQKGDEPDASGDSDVQM